MKRFYKSLSMQKKLTTAFFVCTVIPVLLIFIFGVVSLRDGERAEYTAAAEKKLISTANMIDKVIDENILKSENITRSSFVINGLKRNYDNNIGAVMGFYSELSVFMSGFGIPGEGGTNCVIYPLNDTLPMGEYVESKEKLFKTDIVKKLDNAYNSELVWDYSNISYNNLSGVCEGYISFYRRIHNYEELLGYFETRIYIKDIIYTVQNIPTIDGETVIFKGADGNVFYLNTDDPKLKYDIEYSQSLRDGSVIEIKIDDSDVFKNYYKYLIYYLMGFSILVVVLFFIYRTMVSMLTKDLNDFIGVLQKGKELDESDLKDLSGDPDVAIIKRRFTEILRKTKKMYSDIAEMNRTKKAMELELLQSGINPHLLYNSLSVIKWQMIRLNENGIAEMIDNMTNYYRSVLAGGNHVITIREELELIDTYVKINEFSYENSYTVIKDIDESVLDCPTIKLILQPIVENSILHGLVEKGDGDEGIIKIKIKKDGRNILFTVEDNGYGMSQEDIKKALDLNKAPKRKGGYGIRNTIKRIKTYYGPECGLNIKSEPGKGTVVEINIIDMTRDELKKRLY